jgi:vancomycin aglycone glucosyltransferase
VPRRAAELNAAQFDKLAAAAEGCDALVASGLMLAVAGARSVAEQLGYAADADVWAVTGRS